MSISMEIHGSQVVTKTPYNAVFIQEARDLGGVYEGEAKTWSFDVRDRERVSALLIEVYGTDGSSSETVDVEVTVKSEIRVRCGSVVFAGRKVAQAFGRDSGAKPGEGVVFTTNKPQSGGSVKNWETVIKAGTVFEIRDLAASALSMLDDEYQINYQVLESGAAEPCLLAAELARLESEQQRIVARIEQIKIELQG